MYSEGLYYEYNNYNNNKFNLNENPKFIDYNTFKIELEKTICVMTGKINYKIIDEIINNIDPIELEMNTNSEDKEDLKI